MSVQKAHTYILNLSGVSANQFINDLFLNDIPLQVLNPVDLGSEWEEAEYIQDKIETDLGDQIELVNNVLATVDEQKSMFQAFLDNRRAITYSEVSQMATDHNEWLTIANDLNLFYKSKDQLQNIQNTLKENHNKTVLLGRNASNISKDFENYIHSVLLELQEQNVAVPSEINLPHISSQSIDIYQTIVVDTHNLSILLEYLAQHNLSQVYRPAEDVLIEKEGQIQNLRSALSDYLINDDLTAQTQHQLCTLHAYLEIQLKVQETRMREFKVSTDGKAKFLMVAIPKSNQADFEKYVLEHNMTAEETSWPYDIIKWDQSVSIKPFKNVAQAVGTIDEKESDPSTLLSIFYMAFFAFCLGDAFYGAIVSLFTGYFLFFKPLKKQFESMFRLFFQAGIVTIFYGVLTNSYAGDFFGSSFFASLTGQIWINEFFQNFQLISVINISSTGDFVPPINRVIGDLSPIVAMMIIALFLGFLNALTAYILRISSAFKANDYKVALASISWIVFLSTLIFTIIALNIGGSLTTPAFVGLGIGLLMILFFNEANDFMGKILAFLFGKYGLYGLVQLGADLVSFTRIIAIGLTGGVIAAIVNLIAGMIYDGFGPFFGLFAAIILLVVGHSFNFVLSLFGAYINPLRLTYVEFLPKFFEGRGVAFKPVNSELSKAKIV
jgi:vacuolar-type H+-ATPase subunit I/STV1